MALWELTLLDGPVPGARMVYTNVTALDALRDAVSFYPGVTRITVDGVWASGERRAVWHHRPDPAHFPSYWHPESVCRQVCRLKEYNDGQRVPPAPGAG